MNPQLLEQYNQQIHNQQQLRTLHIEQHKHTVANRDTISIHTIAKAEYAAEAPDRHTARCNMAMKISGVNTVLKTVGAKGVVTYTTSESNDGLSVTSTAMMLGLSENQVKAAYGSALKKLHNLMDFQILEDMITEVRKDMGNGICSSHYSSMMN